MNKISTIAICVTIAAIAGTGYYFYTPKPPPPPANIAQFFTQKMAERLKANPAAAGEGSTTNALVSPGLPTPDGLVVTLENRAPGELTGKVVNPTAAAATYSQPAGRLFSNGKTEVVLLRGMQVEVAAKGSADLELPVARTQPEISETTGNFLPMESGSEPNPLKPLLDLLADRPKTPGAVVETAILMMIHNVSLDRLVDLPSQIPKAMLDGEPKSHGISPAELMAALLLVKETGFDINQLALMSDPQLPIMTMLDRDARTDAMKIFNISQKSEWSFWKYQLLQGDPGMRHFALYGIAQYFPDVALKMLPVWVREAKLSRGYRYSAALALGMIDDPQAMQELQRLSAEQQSDPGLAQTLGRASQHWENKNKASTATVLPVATSTVSL